MMIICLGLFLFLLMDSETSLHWGTSTLEGFFYQRRTFSILGHTHLFVSGFWRSNYLH